MRCIRAESAGTNVTVSNSEILTGLLLFLAVALMVLILGLWRILFEIGVAFYKEREHIRQHSHPTLGVLTADGSLWTCEVRRGERSLRVNVGGSERVPDPRLMAQAVSALEHFFDLENKAIECLRRNEAELEDAQLQFYSLDFLSEQRPSDFTMEFLAGGDDSRVWRVEFIGGEPVKTGFDD